MLTELIVKKMDERYVHLDLRILHAGQNKKTNITPEALAAAEASCSNIPIVGFWNGGDFEGHEYTFEFQEGEIVERYAGTIIGAIPETNNYRLETDTDGRTWVVVSGFIWRDYADYCLSAIYTGKQISMEIHILDFMDTPDVFTILSFIYKGICILGDHRTPAVSDAKLIVSDKALYEIKEEKMKKSMAELYGLEEPAVATTEPVTEPVAATEPAATEPTVEPTTEPVAEPVTEPTVEPVEPTTEPVAEPAEPVVTEPVAEPAQTTEPAEPVVPEQPVTEPATLPVEPPVAEPTVSPVAEYEATINALRNRVLQGYAAEFADVASLEDIQAMTGSVDDIEVQLYAMRGRKATKQEYAIEVNKTNTKPAGNAPVWADLM